MYMRDKRSYIASRPGESLYHINMTESGFHFWRGGTSSEEMLQMVDYLLSAQFPSEFAANTNFNSNIPRLVLDETLFR